MVVKKKIYKLKTFILCGSLFFSQEIFSQIIKIKNNENYPLLNKTINLNRKDIKKYIRKGFYPVIKDSLENIIPSQTNSDTNWSEVYFQVNLAANSANKYSITWQKNKPFYPIQTSIRFGEKKTAQTPVKPVTKSVFKENMLPNLLGFQPYQTDGPTFENDKVGFRHYLDGRHAKDLFGKLSPEISPENVGLTSKGETIDNYHVLEKWGRDILPVGNSVGIGGIALAKNNNFIRIGSTVKDTTYNIYQTTCEIVTEGPIYSQLFINHKKLNVAGNSYNIEERPTIWAGDYAYQNFIKCTSLKTNENLAIGLSTIAKDAVLNEYKTENWVAFYTYDKQSYNNEYNIGLAIIIPNKNFVSINKVTEGEKLSKTYLAKVNTYKKKEPIEYYALGCWELSNPLFETQEGFEKYLKQFLNTLNSSVEVNIF
jgi:hypothetical protein